MRAAQQETDGARPQHGRRTAEEETMAAAAASWWARLGWRSVREGQNTLTSLFYNESDRWRGP